MMKRAGEEKLSQSIAIDVIEGEPEDISFLNGKAVIIEGVAQLRDDIDGSFARRIISTLYIIFNINE